MKLTRNNLLVLVAVLVVFGLAVASAVRLQPFAGVASATGLVWTQDVDHVKVDKGDQCSHCHLAKHKAPLAGPCQDCHTTGTWQSAVRSHETTSMDAQLHGKLRCSQCHTDPNKSPNPECKSCHKTLAHRWEPDCKRCHSLTKWTETNLKDPDSHVKRARRHTRLRCPDCHTFNSASKPPLRCEDCHRKHTEQFPRTAPHEKPKCVKCHNITKARDNFNKARIQGDQCSQCHKPRHEGFVKCGSCHKLKFKDSPYDHDRTWPLTGAHAKVDCVKCHKDLQWRPPPSTSCASCHAIRHTGLRDCAKCHTTAGFDRPKFSHATTYPLRGAHASADCSRCHPGGDLGRTRGTACNSCHAPKHGGLTNCASCHDGGSSAPSVFRHDTAWKKTGAHAKADCASCHPQNRFKTVRGTSCVQCHGVRHGGLTRCDRCHTSTSFVPAKFDHDTAWPKTGAHEGAKCASCHPQGRFARVRGTTCTACHGTKHAGQTQCASCHSSDAWTPPKEGIVHTPKYPLFGQHRFVDCKSCHKNLNFAGTPNQCIDCHAPVAHDHAHKDCAKCHVPRSWKIILPHDPSACQ